MFPFFSCSINVTVKSQNDVTSLHTNQRANISASAVNINTHIFGLFLHCSD